MDQMALAMHFFVRLSFLNAVAQSTHFGYDKKRLRERQ
jgi:hypothetical protein